MKQHYKEMPSSLQGTYAEFSRNFGFDWKEFIMGIPTPMFLVTTYKSNGQPNATMQSWATFTSADHGNGYFAVLASVTKGGHLHQTLNEKKEAVINFMSSDKYEDCMKTIQNNQFEVDEISSSGLTVEKASWVDAPMVEECFMNLECKLIWEKEIVPGDDHAMLCLEVIGLHIDENHLPDRTGESGILYNIHYQVNPENVGKTAHDYAGILQKKIDVMEY